MAETYCCPKCGEPFEPQHLDLKRRTGYCVWCRQPSVFPKRHSKVVGNVDLPVALPQMVTFFKNGDNENALHLASEITGVSEKNVAALYVVAYYNAYRASPKSSGRLYQFFETTLPEAEMEIEEEEALKELFLYTRPHLSDHECTILKKFSEYDDPKELSTFVESFSPTMIAERQNLSWFTPEMATIYAQIAHTGAIPKTTLALVKAIKGNPESPLNTGKFFIRQKAEEIYNRFVLKLSDIIAQIRDPELRAKFEGFYGQMKGAYETGLKQG